MLALNRLTSIYVAGHAGLAGSAIVRRLQALGYSSLWLRPPFLDWEGIVAYLAVTLVAAGHVRMNTRQLPKHRTRKRLGA